MKNNQIFFFAEILDLEPLLKTFEEKKSIFYYQTGLFQNLDIPKYNSIFETPHLGYVSNGDWNHTESFLVLPKNIKINIREVPQRKGGIYYAVDQSLNPKSIILKLSGIYEEGILVGGKVSTISNNDISLELFKLLTSAIKKEFTKVGTFYVGKNAKFKLELGWRLVTNQMSPTEYDLKLT